MTFRQAYEYALIESNKLKAPSMLLEDYIYLFNKAIQQKVNEIYNRFDINQQSSDDLRVLQTTAVLDNNSKISEDSNFFKLPEDYLHILNCIVVFKGSNSKPSYCGPSYLQTVKYPCRRMTADLEAGIMDNYYLKPAVNRPYYYLVTDSASVEEKPGEEDINKSSEEGTVELDS